jgi:hypothetical protein
MGEESDVRTDVRSDVPPSSAADKNRAKKRDKKTSNKKPSASGPPKRRGERAELAFMLKASSLGFGIAKPWGDSERYDFILDSGERLWRVQVRSTEYETHRGYSVHTYVYVKHQMVALTAREIDSHRRLSRPAGHLVRRPGGSVFAVQKPVVLSQRKQEGLPLRNLPRSLVPARRQAETRVRQCTVQRTRRRRPM